MPWDKVAAAVTPRTRIVVNTPHNPTGTILRAADMRKLADIVRGTDILILSDEVYEHMVYDGAQHEASSRHPELAQRAFVVSSFGKTYHVTGWKVGYVAAPAALTAEFRKVHQYNVFTREHADAARPGRLHGRPGAVSRPAGVLPEEARLVPRGPRGDALQAAAVHGTYFQCVAIGDRDLPEAEFAQWLTSEIGVAAIPVSAFYREAHESGIVRFCFAKQEETLATALERLARL